MNHVCCSDRLTKIKFTHTCDQLFKAKFEAISFLTDVSNYCEPQKIKLFIYIYLKISRNLASNFMDFWQFLVTFWHFGAQLSSILRAQSGQAYPRG